METGTIMLSPIGGQRDIKNCFHTAKVQKQKLLGKDRIKKLFNVSLLLFHFV